MSRTTPSRDLQERVRALVGRVGIVRAARQIGLARQTTASLAAGFPCHVATISFAEARTPRA
jgi:hypothetical protein